MENGPFIDDFPSYKPPFIRDFNGFSIPTFDYWRVST
jgi:hypothetical protein